MSQEEEHLERIYCELLDTPVSQVPCELREHYDASFNSYFTSMKSNAIRREMDYFVSCCVDIGINISRFAATGQGLRFDYCTLSRSGKNTWLHSRLLVEGPRKTYSHRHDYYELVYVLSGCLRQMIEEQWVTMQENDILLLDMNAVHTEYIEGDCVVQYLQIPRTVVAGILRETELAPDLVDFFSTQSQKRGSKYRYIFFDRCDHTHLRKLLVNMMEQQAVGGPGSRYIIYGLLIQLMSQLGNTPEYHTITQKTDRDGKVLRQLIQYLEDNRWNVEQEALERDLHYSGSYLNKLLRRTMNMTLTEYCIERRLEYAATLLTSTQLSINEIIERCGYQNKTYFYRVFRNKYGKTPLDLRREYK